MQALARALAARFDARNANTHQSERVETRMSLEPLERPVPLTVLAATPAPGSARDTISKLVEQVARLTEYGDLPAAARARTQVAGALMRAKRWADAAETAEEAVRELDRAGLVDEAASCRYLLSKAYREDHQTKAAIALLDELLESGVQVADVPTPAQLHEEAAAALSYGRAAAERYRKAAHLYAAEERYIDQIRALHGAVRNLTYPKAEAALAPLAEADAVLAAHAQPEPAWREAAANIELAAADILRRTGDPAAAATRAQRAIQTLETTGPAETLARAHVKLASLHLLLENPADAEAAARQALALAPDDEDAWDTAALLAKALVAQDRNDEAARITLQYGLDLDEIDEYDYED
jgi:tetratricopeptide (TPR) repeat protein